MVALILMAPYQHIGFINIIYMEFTRTLKNKQVTRHQDDLMRKAEDTIRIEDFDSNLYIAYEGTPLVPIQEEWTSKKIVQELNKLRTNYVNAKMKDYDPGFVESFLKLRTSC